jgi:hypothetical protein
VKADAPFPSGPRADDWRLTRSRKAAGVNAEVREAVDRDGYSLFRIGLTLSEIPNTFRNTQVIPIGALFAGTLPSTSRCRGNLEELRRVTMGRGILLWLLGVPIPVIILLWLFFGH